MTKERNIPTVLSVVSYIFLILGVLSATDTIVQLSKGSIHLSSGILGLWIYAGLRGCSRSWRTCALATIWIGMTFSAILAILCFLGNRLPYTIFGNRTKPDSPAWMAVLATLFFVLELWQYRVLIRPDIYRLFCEDVAEN